ncbi:Protein of unknown function [Modestobacter sp. DSM 44400]|uniref:DUF2631 domain-containing protein n=1 Tax=Modestobacter sp. DSM 44400 TaxID=1550230 RepID=UPI00089C30A2|nr:DUF2631 domain-containing protein [Modestobacter sp. DSM 44400]SDY64512.1 Protein of unknown function [Modestobacter sp. DSM 44400]
MSEHTGRGQGHQTSARVIEQSNREEGIVRAGSTPIEHERPEDWGWHHEMGKGGRFLLVLPTIFLIAMVFGNHEGNVENIYLVGFAVGIVVIMLWDARRRKNAWRKN